MGAFSVSHSFRTTFLSKALFDLTPDNMGWRFFRRFTYNESN